MILTFPMTANNDELIFNDELFCIPLFRFCAYLVYKQRNRVTRKEENVMSKENTFKRELNMYSVLESGKPLITLDEKITIDEKIKRNINTNRAEAIESLKAEIEEKKEQMELLEHIDFEKPCTEDEWHKLCETDLRTSDLMGILVKSIFPNCESIEVRRNYVSFQLYGFWCYLPTFAKRRIEVDTSWWRRRKGFISFKEYCSRTYYNKAVYEFSEKENKTIYDYVDFVRPWDQKRSNIEKRMIYFFNKKKIHKAVEREYKHLDDIKRQYNEITESNKIQTVAIQQKTKIFTEQLLPELYKFTDKVDAYKFVTYGNVPKVEDIILKCRK